MPGFACAHGLLNLKSFGIIRIPLVWSGRLETTRALFWDGPRDFEPRLDDEDDSWSPFPSFHTAPAGERLTKYVCLECNRLTYTAVLQWNWVSGPEHSGPEAEILPLGHPFHQNLSRTERL
ncbi:hypothetical protein AVEN_104592-1 [Araneus ventricosus]|uniref:Uncharacterized protein n=1 Tax=Araneus ventricosus TaxID=182803 RepID=A0A4Y2BEA2_ARAVE|nr:hypothetical protein AVEN_104592-1 [Araneus ventricosus]